MSLAPNEQYGDGLIQAQVPSTNEMKRLLYVA